MLSDDIIAPSSSPWNSPILVIPKKADASGIKEWRMWWISGNLMMSL
jgi:hypothetical protein